MDFIGFLFFKNNRLNGLKNIVLSKFAMRSDYVNNILVNKNPL